MASAFSKRLVQFVDEHRDWLRGQAEEWVEEYTALRAKSQSNMEELYAQHKLEIIDNRLSFAPIEDENRRLFPTRPLPPRNAAAQRRLTLAGKCAGLAAYHDFLCHRAHAPTADLVWPVPFTTVPGDDSTPSNHTPDAWETLVHEVTGAGDTAEDWEPELEKWLDEAEQAARKSPKPLGRKVSEKEESLQLECFRTWMGWAAPIKSRGEKPMVERFDGYIYREEIKVEGSDGFPLNGEEIKQRANNYCRRHKKKLEEEYRNWPVSPTECSPDIT